MAVTRHNDTYIELMCIGVVGMLMALLAVADESEDRTLDVSASTSDRDETPLFPRRRENARLNELRNYTRRHADTCTHTHTHTHTHIHLHTYIQTYIVSYQLIITSIHLHIHIHREP